jgi:hypothetical protein
VIVDHGLELVLLHVPKCAGTALRKAVLDDANACGREVVSCFDFAYDPVLQRQVDLAHRPLMDLRHAPEWCWLQRYRVIACIRHPYKRLAAACREFLRQKSRTTEMQVRTTPPSREQRLAYLRRLPAAMDAHDLNDDLTNLGEQLNWPDSLRQRLARVGAGDGRRPAAGVEALEQDSDLRALANLLHAGDFNSFGFQPEPADLQDPELKDLIERCLVVGNSHSLPLTNLTPEMRWYYGRTSPKPQLKLKPTRRWRPQP